MTMRYLAVYHSLSKSRLQVNTWRPISPFPCVTLISSGSFWNGQLTHCVSLTCLSTSKPHPESSPYYFSTPPFPLLLSSVVFIASHVWIFMHPNHLYRISLPGLVLNALIVIILFKWCSEYYENSVSAVFLFKFIDIHTYMKWL